MLYFMVDVTNTTQGEPLLMKNSKRATLRRYHSVPRLNFESHALTSFSGLVIIQKLFETTQLKNHLRDCFRHLTVRPIFGHARIMLLLIIHLMLGFRRIRDLKYYEHDPLVKRTLGLTRLPDVATISRSLAHADAKSVEYVQDFSRNHVIEQLKATCPARITVDFDGSVISTKRFAEQTAVGYNKKSKGCRSYYPLFSTIAQTGQVLDMLHRPGNVHDSNGALGFVNHSLLALSVQMPHTTLESRLDGAFYSHKMVDALSQWGVQFSISVPFERLIALKEIVETRSRWKHIDSETSYFEPHWKPQSWDRAYRLIVVRSKKKFQSKEPVQLDMFVPHEYGYDFKVIVTNKTIKAKNVIAFHNGRGSQEGIFAELKSQLNMDIIPFRRLIPNQLYLMAGCIAHNFSRTLQMKVHPCRRTLSAKRTSLWAFQQIQTFRRNILNRAGKLTNPQRALTLTISGNKTVEKEYADIMAALG